LENPLTCERKKQSRPPSADAVCGSGAGPDCAQADSNSAPATKTIAFEKPKVMIRSPDCVLGGALVRQ
jgi:hypothetical protein